MNSTMDSSLGTCLYDGMFNFGKDVLSIFYIMSINETTKDNVDDVPNYEVQLILAIGFLVFLEQFIRIFQNKDLTRFEDVVVNIGSAFIFTLTRVFLYVVVIRVFDYIHTNYAIVDLPLHNPFTWLFSLLLVEFVYYWTHRALHEFNILWAAHQFHHMAEDINITTTIRDSIVDLVIYDVFPIPLALIIPPQILAVHIQFSLIYQVWLHNEVVGHLGPLEYIINTPRQHRVHHGKNPYCIDKNYGALIMIYDRIFGTYQSEKEDEKIVFGCVAPTPKTYDPLTLQFSYYKDIYRKFKKVEGVGNKISALLKGPGWEPGKPRLGLISDVPQPDPSAPKYTYTPYVATWKKTYVYLHGLILVVGFYLMADHPLIRLSPIKGLYCMLYVIFTLTSFGTLFDSRWFAEILEVYRCISYLVFDYFLIAHAEWNVDNNRESMLFYGMWAVRLFHVASILLMVVHFAVRYYVNKTVYPDCSNNGNNAEKCIEKSKDGELGLDVSKPENKSQSGFNCRHLLIVSIMFWLGFVIFMPVYFASVPSCTAFIESF